MVIIFFIVGMIVLDQAVKYWAFTVLQVQGSIPILENIFHLTYVENRGGAFSIFNNKVEIFIILTIIIIGVMVYALRAHQIHTKLGRWSTYFVIAGGIGNLIDRIFRGFVVDLFDFCFLDFPVFNIADIFICLGCFSFLFYFLFQHDRVSTSRHKQKDSEDTEL